MKLKIFIIIVFSIFNFSNAQNCIDFNLSKVFDFDVMLISKDEKELGNVEITIKIFDKWKRVKVQTIKIESEFILKSESFKECSNNKKYLANTYLESTENDFGDLIVADLNFDGKEDIAIKREEGGNGGPLYNFYIQSKNQQFILDIYLTKKVCYFPNYIDSKLKSLQINVRVDSATRKDMTFFYIDKSKTWSEKKL